MATYKTKGIIIKRTDFGEADKLITIFTDTEGKIKIKAKGIRWLLSKNKGHLELFNYTDLLLAEGREIDILASAATIEGFKELKDNLKKTALAYYFAELIDKLTPEKERNKKVFELLLTCFRFLSNSSSSNHLTVQPLIQLFFEFNLLSALGYRPELNLCLHCRKNLEPIVNFFSYRMGGLLCPECGRKLDPRSLRISKDSLKVLRVVLSFPLETVSRLKSDLEIEKELKIISDRFLKELTEREFKSPKFINEVNSA